VFEHLLVPLDGSSLAECVLPHTLALAQTLGARVTLLQVVEQADPSGGTRAIDPLDWQYSEAEAGAYLHEVTERLRTAGLSVAQVLLQGDPAERVIDYAQTEHVDLILLSSHGRSGLSGWNISSVVQKILARAHISILLVPAYHRVTSDLTALRYERMLVPMDGSQRAECVLPLVGALAVEHNSNVLLVHVVRKPELPRRASPSREDQALVEALTERNHSEASLYLEELRARLSPPADVHILIEEHVAATLQHLAVQENVDLVLLSAHGYSGETRWPYGSLATSFMMYGNKPLLIVQDLPRHAFEPTAAELAAREHGRH